MTNALVEDEQAYADLADELNDLDVGPFDPDDWKPDLVEQAKRYAERAGLSFPPGHGDFDRYYAARRDRGIGAGQTIARVAFWLVAAAGLVLLLGVS